MKKIIKYIFLFTLLVNLISCDNFLSEDPQSSLSTDQFFASKQDALSAINNLYREGFPSLYNASSAYMGPTIMYGGYMSGLYDNQYKGQERFVQDAQSLTIDPIADNSYLLNIWRNCYSAVSRANTALKYIPQTPGLTDAEKNQYLAEAKFFRAINYFELTKMFGKVPLVTEPYESMANSSEFYVTPSPEADVYNLLVQDLTSALNEGGLNDLPMPKNGFRISRGSVAALLADVYLNMSGYPVLSNKYAEAAATAKSLISDPAYSLIQNGGTAAQSAYNTLRTSDDQNEYLYVIEYNSNIANGGWRPVYSFPNEAATWGEFTYSITDLAYQPSATLIAAYDKTNDLRIQEKQYFHTSYTYRKGDHAGQTVQFGNYYPYFWFEEDALYTTNISTKDQTHYRLAEMYLIAAEALVQSGGAVTDEAAGYLAEIKARASLNQTKDQIKAGLLTLNKDAFIREVWAEKIRELIFENKIWNDITRTRMYPTVVGGTFTFVPLIGATNPWGKTFAEKDLVLPYPNDEVQRNPNLQN